MAEKDCNVISTNTGQACVAVMAAQKKVIFVPKYNSLGVLNEIDLTAGPFDAAYFAARVNDPDPSMRWYPLPEMKNISDLRADPELKKWDDNTSSYIQEGNRTFMGIIIESDAPPQMQGKIDDKRGQGMAIFVVDKNRNFKGKIGSDETKFAPVEIESDSLFAVWQPTLNKDVQQIKVQFDISINEKDSELKMIAFAELAYDPSLLRGLIDVTSVVSGVTATTATIKLVTDGGDALAPVLVKNLLVTDFVLHNLTTPGVISKTMTQPIPGVYIFTYTTLGTDVVQVVPTKDGYDFTAVLANTYHN